MKIENILIGDIGATKTTLAVYASDSDPRSPIIDATYQSDQYQSFYELVKEFLEGIDFHVSRASIGVAGPVFDGKVRVTNLPWEISNEELEKRFDLISVLLMNDLEATANFLLELNKDELETLNSGSPYEHSPLTIIAPGTGLGESFMTWDGSKYVSHPSEGGNVDFAPKSARETELLQYLQKEYEQVSYEMVCSGKGIFRIYRFLRDISCASESASLAERMKSVDDPTPLIVQEAIESDSPCRLCLETMNMFVSILGSEAGNLALRVLSTGGVFLGGGIPPRILPLLKGPIFMDAFTQKGPMKELMNRIPVHVIKNPQAPLMGAALLGLNAIKSS
jgi:glucokinase